MRKAARSLPSSQTLIGLTTSVATDGCSPWADYRPTGIEELDRAVWHAACLVMRNPAYLRSRLEKTDELWSPDEQIVHYTHLIAECDAAERGLGAELAGLQGDPALAGLRADIIERAKRNAAARTVHEANRDLAVAEKERRASREARIEAVIARMERQADNLTDLTAEQRRQILLDLHPDIRIGRQDNGHPAVIIGFDLSDDAAIHAPGDSLYSNIVFRDTAGAAYYLYATAGWDDRPLDTADDTVVISPPEELTEEEYERRLAEHRGEPDELDLKLRELEQRRATLPQHPASST